MAIHTNHADLHEATRVFVTDLAPQDVPLRLTIIMESNPCADEATSPIKPEQPAASNQDWLASDEAAFMMGM